MGHAQVSERKYLKCNGFHRICFPNGYISFNDLFSSSSSQSIDHESCQTAPAAIPILTCSLNFLARVLRGRDENKLAGWILFL